MRFTPKSIFGILLISSGCAVVPTGPSVMVLPGAGHSFEQFQADNAVCQQFASFQIGDTTASNAGVESGVASAAVGTAIGAAAGAAFTGSAGGAAVGAGTGLLAGSLVGTSTANRSMTGTQQRYDTGYIQCMYAKGHQVPVTGQFTPQRSGAAIPPPPPSTPASSSIPPPPPGSPPPPPPQ